MLTFWIPTAALAGAFGASVGLVQSGLVDSRHELEAGFAARSDVGADFLGVFVEDVFARQVAQAETYLTGAEVEPGDIAAAARHLQAHVALLLDDEAVALTCYPENDRLVGTDVTGAYDGLDRAVEGSRNVSGVVTVPGIDPSFVSFNLPFDTPFGPRVFAAGMTASDTPIAAFLAQSTAGSAREAHLVDADGVLVASSTAATGALARTEPALAAALATPRDTTYRDEGSHRYTAAAVPGTPWTLVLTIGTDDLYEPLEDVRLATYVVLSVLTIAAIWIVVLLATTRRRARRLATDAATDPLTGIGNRRTLVSWAAGVAGATPVAALVIDLDRLKEINDRWGHHVGDEALQAVAGRVRLAVRAGDQIARWGGDEFAVVMPNADTGAARETSERVRRAIATPVATAAGMVDITSSIGVATGLADSLDDVLASADRALYEAKRTGRNRVVMAADLGPGR